MFRTVSLAVGPGEMRVTDKAEEPFELDKAQSAPAEAGTGVRLPEEAAAAGVLPLSLFARAFRTNSSRGSEGEAEGAAAGAIGIRAAALAELENPEAERIPGRLV